MILAKNGAMAEDRYIAVLDDAPIPDTAAVLVPAARYLADAAELSRRQAPAGVVWPNDRNVAGLVPHLPNLSLVALQFPSFRDGRAYSLARLLRERHGY